jgi:hypothetical protein
VAVVFRNSKHCSVFPQLACIQFDLKGIRPDIKKYLKGKVIPLQAFTGPEGSRRLRL